MTKNLILSNAGPTFFYDSDEMDRYAAYAAIVEKYLHKNDFLTSFNRNEALRIISNYQRHGIPLVPIFLKKRILKIAF